MPCGEHPDESARHRPPLGYVWFDGLSSIWFINNDEMLIFQMGPLLTQRKEHSFTVTSHFHITWGQKLQSHSTVSKITLEITDVKQSKNEHCE